MKIKTLKLTPEQIKELEPFINSRPLTGPWIFAGQLRVKQKGTKFEETEIKLGLFTGQEAVEVSDEINRVIQNEKSKSEQLNPMDSE